MSWWTYVVGSVVVDTFTYEESEESVKKYLESLPETSGSEGGCEYHVDILDGYNVYGGGYDDDGNLLKYQTKYAISIVGMLRDTDAKTVRDELLNILKTIYVDKWDIEMCSIYIHDNTHSIHFTKGYCENKLTYVTEEDGKQSKEIIELE